MALPLALALAAVLAADGAPATSAPPARAAPAPKPAAAPAAARPAAPRAEKAFTRATSCRPTSAWRCTAEGCAPATEGLHAELFDLDAAGATLGACLYTDCYSGKARVTRDESRPWLVTAIGVVRSDRPAGSVPPPGSAPFPLTVSVDLRTGRFTATWAHAPDGLQVDHGACELRARSRRGAGRAAAAARVRQARRGRWRRTSPPCR